MAFDLDLDVDLDVLFVFSERNSYLQLEIYRSAFEAILRGKVRSTSRIQIDIIDLDL